MNTEALVLLQMFCDFKESLIDELGIRQRLNKLSGNVASVEVVWNDLLQRRFFQIPDIMKYLSEPSKQKIVFCPDRTAEGKLLFFLDQARVIYREILYQVYLNKKGFDRIINPQNLQRSSWAAFIVAFVINILFAAYYTAEDYKNEVEAEGDDDGWALGKIDGIDPVLAQNIGNGNTDTDTITETVFYLNILLVIIASFTVFLYETVKVPVIYEMYMDDEDADPKWTLLRSIFDPMAMYYMIVLIISILGLASSPDVANLNVM